jgi:PAS domain S-box-containing protein
VLSFERFKNFPIRFKLLIAYSVIAIISIAVGSFITYSFVRRTIEANIESELKNSTATLLNMVRTSAAISIKNHLRAVAERNREIVTYFYSLSQGGLISEAEAKERVRNVLLSQKIGTTGYIYCLDSRGIIAIHPKKALLGVDLSDNAFIRDQKKRKDGYLEYDWKNPGETHSRPKALYMTYFAPWDWIISVSSYRSEFNELIKVGDFRQSILSLQFGKTGYSYVLDTNGNLIVHPQLQGHNYFNAKDASGRYFIKEICQRKSGKITYAWRNPGESESRKKLVIFNHIPEYKWIVASSSYLEEFYAPLETVRNIIIVTVIVSLLVVLPATFRISDSITNPLKKLMAHFSTAADGDISVRMEPQSKDEIGQLARFFNRFMDRLEVYRSDLETEIRDRQKAEAAIRQSEAKYRELVQNANSIILRMDTEGNITFFNEYAQRFFGYAENEIVGRHAIGTIVPQEDTAGHDLKVMIGKLSRKPGKFRYYESENRRRDGQKVYISWTNRAIRDQQGRVVENLCIGNDVTESRRAGQEMTRMRLYLQNIVDSMPSILVGIDIKNRITLWNQEAEQATGIARQAALQQKLISVFPRLKAQMPLVAEAATAMLACARIGAIHSVVFGGFAAKELATRIDDAKPKVIVSASCGIEIQKIIKYKPLLDKAIDLSSLKPDKCVILHRSMEEAAMIAGRDLDWEEALV